MAVEGVNLQCVDCHKTEKHIISGKMYSLSSMNKNRSTCEQCHTENPHSDDILNEHTYKVSCQTCHIPIYAKVNATKTEWDWSAAGKLKNGKPYEENDADGNHSYLSIKGSFKWGKNLMPEYIWFNGTADHYLLGDVIEDTTKPLEINSLNGSYSDKESKIIPVKIHRAIQPFDPVYKVLIQPKLFADKKGVGAYWQDFDWRKASDVGMKEADIKFSGEVSFIKTEMYWPVNHMVSTKELTVQCNECHTNENSRLASLTDFYMPARDSSPFIETAGVGIILLTLFGVITHGTVRIFSRKNRKG
jgi:octaheme c-type cytochrome (tetrathionate reductase family)